MYRVKKIRAGVSPETISITWWGTTWYHGHYRRGEGWRRFRVDGQTFRLTNGENIIESHYSPYVEHAVWDFSRGPLVDLAIGFDGPQRVIPAGHTRYYLGTKNVVFTVGYPGIGRHFTDGGGFRTIGKSEVLVETLCPAPCNLVSRRTWLTERVRVVVWSGRPKHHHDMYVDQDRSHEFSEVERWLVTPLVCWQTWGVRAQSAWTGLYSRVKS